MVVFKDFRLFEVSKFFELKSVEAYNKLPRGANVSIRGIIKVHIATRGGPLNTMAEHQLQKEMVKIQNILDQGMDEDYCSSGLQVANSAYIRILCP